MNKPLVYAVGGQVRDMIIGVEPKDRDFVVVGATHEYMVEQGFSKIDASFPVYTHSTIDGEFALARTERKTGKKHTDFEVVFDPSVTLLEDLNRRDFTINALAMQAVSNITDPDVQLSTEIIDPFGGIAHIHDKKIVHVAAAFVEDPLRVLRAARFASRYCYDIDSSTMDAMTQMVSLGSINNLTAERVWLEITKVFAQKTGDVTRFFHYMSVCGANRVLWPEINECLHPTLTQFQMTGNAPLMFAAWMQSASDINAVERFCNTYKVPTYFKDLAVILYNIDKHPAFVGPQDGTKFFDLLSHIKTFSNKTKMYRDCLSFIIQLISTGNVRKLMNVVTVAKTVKVLDVVNAGFHKEHITVEFHRRIVDNINTYLNTDNK